MKWDRKKRREIVQSTGNESLGGKNSGSKKFVPFFVSINTAAYLQKNKKDESRNVCLSPLVRMKE